MPCLDLLVLGKAKSPTIPFLPLLSASDDQPKPQKLRDKTRLHEELFERLLLPFSVIQSFIYISLQKIDRAD